MRHKIVSKKNQAAAKGANEEPKKSKRGARAELNRTQAGGQSSKRRPGSQKGCQFRRIQSATVSSVAPPFWGVFRFSFYFIFSFFFKEKKEDERLRPATFMSLGGNHRFHPRIYTKSWFSKKRKSTLPPARKRPQYPKNEGGIQQ